MTTREQAFAAKRMVDDETFTDAVETAMALLNKQLLTAKTPEDRELKFQEYSGLKRVVNDLKKLATETERFKAEY